MKVSTLVDRNGKTIEVTHCGIESTEKGSDRWLDKTDEFSLTERHRIEQREQLIFVKSMSILHQHGVRCNIDMIRKRIPLPGV
jgi:hypothetical protein